MATKTAKPKITKPAKAAPAGMEAPVYNAQGKEAGKVTLPENLFGLPWNADLVHQVVVGIQANARRGTAHTKDRSEVRGGGRKPWKQKGTGRARHGSSRSPIWTGGGVTHGPRSDKNYAKKISQKMRQKALLVTLSRTFRDGEVVFVDALEAPEPKARLAKEFLSAVAPKFAGLDKKKNAALIALPTRHLPTFKSFGNFGNIEVEEVRNLNPVSVLSKKYLVIAAPQTSFDILAQKSVVKK